MPFNRPTLPDLIDQGAAQFEARLPGLLARARRSLIGVLNRVIAGGLAALYGYVEWLDRQKWPDLADDEYLQAHGDRWGVARTPSTYASGAFTFTGTNGSIVPAGIELQRVDGARFVTAAGGAIAGGAVVVGISASVAGVAGNTLVNTVLQLTSPLAGVNSVGLVTTALTQGTDTETDESYRARILRRIRQVPQGGAEADYVDWAMAVPGVTRVWVYPLENGPGTVVVRFTRDNDASFIPDPAEVAAVQAAVDAVRPVTAAVSVQAPAARAVDFSLRITPDTAAVRLAVLAELDALLRREDTGQTGANRPGGTVLLSQLREAVSVAAGETDHVMTAPVANVVLPANTMAVLGTVQWL